jgi:hypothetical protein
METECRAFILRIRAAILRHGGEQRKGLGIIIIDRDRTRAENVWLHKNTADTEFVRMLFSENIQNVTTNYYPKKLVLIKQLIKLLPTQYFGTISFIYVCWNSECEHRSH